MSSVSHVTDARCLFLYLTVNITSVTVSCLLSNKKICSCFASSQSESSVMFLATLASWKGSGMSHIHRRLSGVDLGGQTDAAGTTLPIASDKQIWQKHDTGHSCDQLDVGLSYDTINAKFLVNIKCVHVVFLFLPLVPAEASVHYFLIGL